MVTFVTSLIGAAALFARVTSAVPMEYGGDASSSSMAEPSYSTPSSQYGSGDGGYGKGYGSGYGDSSESSSAAMPEYTTPSYGSGDSTYSSPPPAYTSMQYGSGSSNWNNGGYDNCVQQCVAQFGSPSTMYMPPEASMTASAGSYGNGATHTVWVAPTQGVLRYVPFAVNASVGDTVKFIWGANNHTVTKSAELDLCNKTGDQPFTSGTQDKTFVFTQVVNDTNPTFYYCGTPTHCQKGMFGIINPPNAFGQNSSAAMMMPSLAGEYPSTGAGMSYTQNVTSGNDAAAGWGGSIDLSKMPSWSQSYAAENILFARAFFAMNPETISADGKVDLSPLSTNPIQFPTDVAAASRLDYGDSPSSSSSAAEPSSTADGSSTPNSATSKGGSSNGAGALSSPRVAIALVAVAAAFFAL